MRVEPAPYVFRNEDRRGRPFDRRANEERRSDETVTIRRARHAAHNWLTPAFGAHLLGQVTIETVVPARAARAYSQPEAQTPLRPSVVKSA
jgi:hypothetical protein